MARCAYCRSFVFFGGAREADRRYCNANCQHLAALRLRAEHLPIAVVQQRISEVQRGQCLRCRGQGPLDIHTSYWVWSALILTRWDKTPALTCRTCATKRQAGHLVSSLLVGWWGFPWGFLITPLQLFRNVAALLRGRADAGASRELEQFVRAQIVSEQILPEQRAQQGLT